MASTDTPLALWDAAEQELREYKFAGDLRIQPRWDIPEKLGIHVAIAGRFSKEQETQHPTTLDGFLQEASKVIDAGATGVHIDYGFLIDEHGRRLDRDYSPLETYRAVLGPLRERHGRRFVANLNVLNGETFDECMGPVREGLCEVGPCAAGHPSRFAVPAVEALQESGGKPEIVIHSPGEIELAKRRLIDTGILEKPYTFIILYGLPFDSGRTLLSGSWCPNTQDMATQLFLMVNQLKALDEGALITVCAAGRATMYMTTLATMMGLHIRVGTEDTYWRSPLRDDVVENNLEMFTTARTIARLLGREVASADEYRAALGLGPSREAEAPLSSSDARV
jgi:3-keto-5-aminohexanoate cleavage enzyme